MNIGTMEMFVFDDVLVDRYNGLVETKHTLSGLSVADPFTTNLYADLVGAADTECLFLPFDKSEADVWTCSNDNGPWRPDIEQCLVSVNKFDSKCIRSEQRSLFSVQEASVDFGDALFKDWTVIRVPSKDVVVSSASTAPPMEISSSSKAAADTVGLRWAYTHSNGHNFHNCDKTEISIRVDILCAPRPGE